MPESILVERRDNALWLTLNRPDAHNALNRAMTSQLADAFRDAAGDDTIRTVVLTAAGDRTFCAGADLKGDAGGTFATGRAENPLVQVYRAMRDCHKPIIGRINGSALGGGLGLVSACDLAFAAAHARFGTPEVKVGVFPMMITTYLIRQLPRRRYWEMAFLGEPLSAEEAQRYHLINRAVPARELDGHVADVIARLEANSPNALRLGKQALDLMQDMSVDQTLAYAELMIERLAGSDEAREGMAAFAEKRKPRWASVQRGRHE
ncbi:3-hydroxypropionyl-coenzyme A dehydratase (plasmid) [Cupriavidus necator N-1]|uniref:3-hydroxypropionyl-coenzyme A dehydratase n=1 Tax=Cupriavidus necator (strain ATCC 43291 / DSM 13513 / CCUG 52238 / LMG 8453 / N-1) TaxID=1042878 RepID=F8GUA7_CUPNN|nr:enoyl-CoA hydratase-related protein [Cupriavidus necator]AEI82311.1 3-hydroxypropionyl-coenzyme A dehydratase [Cupriavidus necator N-1]MDX6007328.1 enoyl-CoA hydratase-related protein [Cupriavidus necator]